MRLFRACFAAVLVSSLCVFGCLSQHSARRDPTERSWNLVATENFRVVSDLDGSQAEELAVALEQDVRLIAQAAFGTVKPVARPTDVIVFSKGAHFHLYFPKSVGGVAFPRVPLIPESHYTVVTFGKVEPSTRATLRHELVHDLFARRFGAAPPWLSEGFAEYFSTVELVDGKIHIGKALPDRVLTRESEPTSLVENGARVLALPFNMIPGPSDLLDMTPGEFYLSDRDSPYDTYASVERAAHYFGAWAFIHFLMDAQGDYKRRFNEFLRVVRTTSVTHAWESAFAGVGSKKLDRDFESYLRGGKLSISAAPYQTSGTAKRPTAMALETSEKHVLQARLALTANLPADEKETLFQKHIAAATNSVPPSPEAYYLQGLSAEARGDDARAKLALEKAVELAPKDPRFLRSALRHRLETDGAKMTEHEISKVRADIEKLVSVASSPFDYFLAAHFFAGIGETGQALLQSRHGIGLDPMDPFALAEYASVLEACDDLERAVATQRLAVELLNEYPGIQKPLSKELARLESQKRQKEASPKTFP